MASPFSSYVIYCSMCYGDIEDHLFTRCIIRRCTTPFFHDECIGATPNFGNWTCPKCRYEFNNRLNPNIDYWAGPQPHDLIGAAALLPMVNTSVIVAGGGFQAIRQEAEANNFEGDIQYALTHSPGDLSDEIRSLRNELADLNIRFDTLNTNLTHTGTRVDEVFSQSGTPDINDKDLETYQSEILIIKNQMARYTESLRSQVELVGIPEREGENHFGIVGLAARRLGVQLHDDDLDWAARMDPQHSSDTGSNICRPLVVRFVEKAKRNQFLRAGKATRNLTTRDLNVSGPTRRVYINERLTREVRCLFHEARFRSKMHGFKFCWIQNNSVFVRKGEGYPAVRLLSQHDLNIKVGDDLAPEHDVGQSDDSDD